MNQSEKPVYILEKFTENKEEWIPDPYREGLFFLPIKIHLYKIRVSLENREHIIRVTGATYRKLQVGMHTKLKLQSWKLPTGFGYYETAINRGYLYNGDFSVLNH